MRVVAMVVAFAGCGRFGFGGDRVDGALGGDASDGSVIADGTTPDAVPACSPAFELCDGFEAATIDTTTWALDSNVTLDSTRAHRGAHSIHIHADAFAANTSTYTSLGESKTIVGSTTFWVRSWFWLSALPAPGNGMELISAEQPGVGGDYLFVFSDSTHIYTQFGNASEIGMTTVPIGSWFCVVWKVVRSTTTTGALELAGELPMLSLPNVTTDSSTNPMNALYLGMGFASSNAPTAQPALDLWIDDVIVDDAALTCAD